MREVPDCLNRRYKALDELIQEISALSPRGSEVEYPPSQSESTTDPGIKLMCEFWNILKEDPDCNLTQHVKQRMGLTTASSVFHPQRVTCYMAGKGKPCCKVEGEDKRREALNKLKNLCCQGSASKDSKKCCAAKSASPSSSSSDTLPLSKVLCNLKEAASFDKKCNTKINELMDTQNELMNQINHLEHREKEGIQLLKQADCMWSCMEDAYKKRVAESLERQKNLMKQLKDVEASNAKWRRNKKDLDIQMTNINKCQQEISDKLIQKKNDIKCMDMEINDFKKRIESNKKETDTAKKSLSHKKQASDIKVASIAAEVTSLQKSLGEENKFKYNKEQDGTKFVKEAREDLQKICRILLQKKLENEDLRAEKDACLQEIDLLNQTMNLCKNRCKSKQDTVIEEIKKLDNEISTFKVKCIRCHQCTDTVDVRKYCTDCPRCIEERDCIYEDDHCSPDKTMDCVCMSVKQKFLDNVFDNMYTVLERQSKTGPGKAVAEAVLGCLRRSRNGKLNDETKKILQNFILNTVKKNLNLTIIGGAVKTRCEMDPDTYKQLMLCLKQVTAVKAPKVDKGTVAKKESCRRWGGTSECNCPSGPKACICTKKAPPPPKDPTPCPPSKDKEDDPGEVAVCPHKDSTACGPDCAMHAVPSCVGADVAQWRPDPCSGSACPFSKSMRAAQCVLGPESLNSLPKSYMSTVPYVPDIPVLDDLITCRCGKTPVKPCTCRGDRRSRPRERIIEEVMGKYIEVSPIEKVTSKDEHESSLKSTVNKACNCTTVNNARLLASKASVMQSQKRDRSSEFILLEGTDALIEMLKRKKMTHVCKNIKCNDVPQAKRLVRLFPNPEPNAKLGKTDTKLTVILDPKFHPPNTKMNENTSPLTSYLSTCNSMCNEDASGKNSVGTNNNSSSVSYFGRDICDTVKDLMKDVIVSESIAKNYGPEVEWMTVESFIRKLPSSPPTPKENSSNITDEEIEVKNEALEGSTKDDFGLYIKILLNEMVSEKVSETPIKFHNISTNSENKDLWNSSLSVAVKREREQNEILNHQINGNVFSQNLLSDSSIPDKVNKTKSHGKCIQYFIQAMSRKTESKKCEEGNPKYKNSNCTCDNKNTKTPTTKSNCTRKPMNLHKYLSDNFVDREMSTSGQTKKYFMVPEARNFSKPKVYNTKQLKASTVKSCDRSTCATVWEQETDDVHRRYSLIEKEIRKESYVKYPALGQTITKDTSSLQADIFSKGQFMLDVDQSIEKNMTGNKSVTFAEKVKDTTKDQFKIVIGDDETNKSLTELTKTSSGTLAIALDEKVIDLIDKKTTENPNILVTLTKTDSGQFTVNFNAEDSPTEDAYRVLVSKTSSGTRMLEVHNNFIKKLQTKTEVNQDVKEICEKKAEKSNEKKAKKNKDKTSVSSKNGIKSDSSNLNKKTNVNKIRDNDLLNKYNANKRIDIKVVGANGPITEIKAPLTKTFSGNIAVNVHELALLGDMQAKERAVTLQQSESGSYHLDIRRDNETSNAVIRKTPSGGVLVVLTDIVLKPMETARTMQKEEFFKLRINNMKCDANDPPAVLKSTPSQNYLIVIDKEYEREYKTVVNDAVEDDIECYINMSRTSSDKYLIVLNENDECFEPNAILVKTPSGNIKIMKNLSTEKFHRWRSIDSGSKAFSEILNKLRPSRKLSSCGTSFATRLSCTKSSSDSNLYDKIKCLTPNQTDLLTNPLATLSKSNSGQYAVVMGKESKKSFINNLKSYLQNNPQGLIPVKRSESGEITIVLNDDQKEKTHYGSLKITPSGNIYVMVDETVVKGIEKEKHTLQKSAITEHSAIDTRSTHMIGKLKHPVNKAVATTCNANPSTSCCDTSKCICKERNWDQDTPEKEDGLRLFRPEMCGIDWSKIKRNPDGSYKICDPDKCTENCCNSSPRREYTKPKDKLTHIVIKPCECKPVFKNNPHDTEQCFYYVEAVCPYHKDRYDTVSNDLLEISGLCKKTSEKERFKNSKRIKNKPKNLLNNTNWDSLHFLPPQLPAFLSEFKYR